MQKTATNDVFCTSFFRVSLDKAQTKQVKFELSHYDLAVWSVVNARWEVPEGDFTIYVGRSAFDEDSLRGTIPASSLPGPHADIYAQ